VHPRPDERHVTRNDVRVLSELLRDKQGVEFNIEGYPSKEFLELVIAAVPDQCTLVPDAPDQLTSDHGWDVTTHEKLLGSTVEKLHNAGIRSSLFINPDPYAIDPVKPLGANRVELYTEAYANAFGTPLEESTWQRYRDAAVHATSLGIGLNAGHDLDLRNLPRFLQIPGILEVSIGHALVVESLQHGMPAVIEKYLAITSA